MFVRFPQLYGGQQWDRGGRVVKKKKKMKKKKVMVGTDVRKGIDESI